MKNPFPSLKSFALKCKRVWLILKKPSKKEFQQVAKISAFGVLVLGLLGFVIAIIMKLFA